MSVTKLSLGLSSFSLVFIHREKYLQIQIATERDYVQIAGNLLLHAKVTIMHANI